MAEAGVAKKQSIYEIAGEGLRADNFADLNAEFYGSQPWVYFRQRLTNLMLAAGARDRYRALLAEGVSLGNVDFAVELPTDDEPSPTAEQTFVAIEGEMLLHHAAETLLRFVHAHAEPSPCPWLRMSRLVSAQQFKRWVDDHVLAAGLEGRSALCQAVLAPGGDHGAAICAEYLELLARYFLESDSYNAAKHGMSVRGGAEQTAVTVGDKEILNRGGATVRWLAIWPRDDKATPPRWTRMSRVSSTEATVSLIFLTTQFMEAVWLQGRQRHLGEVPEREFRPRSLEQLLATQELTGSHVIADFYEPLSYHGVEPILVARSANFAILPGEASDTFGEDAAGADEAAAPDG